MLSAVLITRNAASVIEPCLDSLAFADEVVIDFPSVAPAVEQSHGLPATHFSHLPQRAIAASTTWSPGTTVVTEGPTASTTPAPSWPSTIGSGSWRAPRRPFRSL